ncbi:MAG: skn1, partial [Caulobacter sp.]|nr:skn1 [Caulobacter sp.]
WNSGKVTDFTPGADVLDLRGLFAKTTYGGSDPVADHRLEFRADGQGSTQVYLDMDGPGGDWPTLVTTLAHVTPSQISAGDWLFH